MRMTRSLLLTGTMLPTLLLAVPVQARSPNEGTSARMELAQLGEEGPRGGRGGGAERGGGAGERGGGAARERPEAPAARERPEPRQAPAARERPEAPAARERPEPRQAPAARERPEAPSSRERPEPRQAPATREKPEAPAARERPEPKQAPAAREAPERATPPAQRQTPERPTPPTQPTRPTPPTSEEPSRTAPTRPTTPPAAQPQTAPAPAQRRAPDAPTQPGATPPTTPQPQRPASPEVPAQQNRQQPAQPNAVTPPGQTQPGVTQPGTAPGAAPAAPNQRPGVPGRPFTPQGQQPNAAPPGQPGAQPGVQPGQDPNQFRREQQPGQLPPGQTQPGQQPNQLQQNQLQPGQQPGGVGRDGRGGPGFDNDRRGDGRYGDDRRGGFNRPGAPGYIPGGFRDSREDDEIRDYDRIRRDRQEYNVDGRNYYREPGRIIVRDRDNYYIRHDENERFRDLDRRAYRSERRGNETYSYIDRPGGEQIVTVVDDDGRLVRRYRRFRDGREVIIINNGYGPGGPRPIYDDVVDLPPPDIRIPRDRYVVDYDRADARAVYGALTAPPVTAIDRRYSLDQVRYSPQLRARMPSVDINTITFDSGSFTVTPEQGRQLKNIADAINQAVQANPQEVFLIEGYTDAVGADIDNLSLSDRRAQSVATILTQNFQVPPENLTTQGYGEQYLKVNTQEANRENRRVTVRRITPLLQQQADQGQQGGSPPPPPPR
ncbi:OmpA family protein [Methylobacterium sp. C25]|uniref:OmpA family protein n=1 Tax=Methylobacterium sp. C25 TaxID=2721622 RepID=UPI001F4373E6|nr:OmpA family protein [Methylobacterium sp. C25]MCE4222987.1 OmpA family protein [Methylobacterium sp. C25]